MALILNVPTLEAQPLLPAESRPQKIRQFLEGLPGSNPQQSARSMLEELQPFNRQKIPADTRVKALELYRAAIKNTSEALAAQYCNTTLPLPAAAKTHAALAESLWQELGYGYKLALLDQKQKLFSMDGSKSTALMLQRAIEASGQLAMVYYQTYFSPGPALWSDLHQLYLYAVQQSLQDISVIADGKQTSISLTYKQALLMALADPQHLSPQGIKLAQDYTARFAQRVQLQDLGTLADPTGIFLVSLTSNKPPVPYIKNVEKTNASTDILMITVDLARLLHQQIQMLQSGNIARNSGLPDEASDPRYLDILTYLIKHWGTSPKRIFTRTPKIDGAALGIGLQAAHYFFNDEQHYTQPVSEDSPTDISARTGYSGHHDIQSSRWKIINISAGGMALRKFPLIEGDVRVGELLSVKSNNASHWYVAAIRWASHDDKQQLSIGIEMIAPQAEAVGVRRPGQAEFEPALLLAEVSKLKQATSIITSSGTYAPARLLELDTNGKISRIMLTRLVERTGSFERFQFSRL